MQLANRVKAGVAIYDLLGCHFSFRGVKLQGVEVITRNITPTLLASRYTLLRLPLQEKN